MSGYQDDQERRAQIDLLLLDLEHRIAQVRESNVRAAELAASMQLNITDIRLADRRFWIAAIAAGATLVAAGGGLFAAGAAIWKAPTPIVVQVQR